MEQVKNLNLWVTLKRVFFVSLKFYLFVGLVILAIFLPFQLPQDVPFTMSAFSAFLHGFLTHPLIYAGFGVIFMGFFLITIADRWVKR